MLLQIESKVDKEMELVVDITGSEGAAIEGTYKTTKVLTLKAMAYEEVA